jgi:hypothetical protein
MPLLNTSRSSINYMCKVRHIVAPNLRHTPQVNFSVRDGVCNPVRNVSALKRYGRGCKPRPAFLACGTGFATPSVTFPSLKPAGLQTPSGILLFL